MSRDTPWQRFPALRGTFFHDSGTGRLFISDVILITRIMKKTRKTVKSSYLYHSSMLPTWHCVTHNIPLSNGLVTVTQCQDGLYQKVVIDCVHVPQHHNIWVRKAVFGGSVRFEISRLLKCDPVSLGKWRPTFRTNHNVHRQGPCLMLGQLYVSFVLWLEFNAFTSVMIDDHMLCTLK